MPNDFLSSSAHPANSTMLSAVMKINYWDPKNQAELVSPDVSSGMIIEYYKFTKTNNTYAVILLFLHGRPEII